MRLRLAAIALVLTAFAGAHDVCAQAAAAAPRDLWPQATAAAREGDVENATRRVASMITTGRTYGIKAFPMYAAGAAGLASESSAQSPDVAKWASNTAALLDSTSPAVAFLEADRAARRKDWGKAIPLAFQGFARVLANYRTRTLSQADLMIVGALALCITAIVFAVALFFRYGRSMAHDFREMLSRRVTGGSVTVLAFALLFLPLFLWLGPVWLAFYWFAIFFAYASVPERIATAVLLLLVALAPLAVDHAAHRSAGVESPVVMAALSSEEQAYQPEALRRLQELIGVVSDDPVLHLLVGNMQSFEGSDEQAGQHYRRAIELRPGYAGAHVNLGNLLYLNNEFQAAMTEYEKAEQADPNLAVAFFNHSVAAGETYKFDLQASMLEKARNAERSFVERVTRNPPPQKILMYNPPVEQAWTVTDTLSKRPAARALFGNYSAFDPVRSVTTPTTIGAILSLVLGIALWLKRRRSGLANACIKCGRTFCPRCKSARESTTYCTQCIHIYLKRDGVSLDTKRQKLEEVTDHQAGVARRNKLFATFIPGSAQMLEGRTVSGIIGTLAFCVCVAVAILIGRLAPAIGPTADVAHNLVRIAAILLALIIWATMSLPVYRRKVVV